MDESLTYNGRHNDGDTVLESKRWYLEANTEGFSLTPAGQRDAYDLPSPVGATTSTSHPPITHLHISSCGPRKFT